MKLLKNSVNILIERMESVAETGEVCGSWMLKVSTHGDGDAMPVLSHKQLAWRYTENVVKRGGTFLAVFLRNILLYCSFPF